MTTNTQPDTTIVLDDMLVKHRLALIAGLNEFYSDPENMIQECIYEDGKPTTRFRKIFGMLDLPRGEHCYLKRVPGNLASDMIQLLRNDKDEITDYGLTYQGLALSEHPKTGVSHWERQWLLFHLKCACESMFAAQGSEVKLKVPSGVFAGVAEAVYHLEKCRLVMGEMSKKARAAA